MAVVRYTRAYASKMKNGHWRAILTGTDAAGARRQKTKVMREARTRYQAERMANKLMEAENARISAAQPALCGNDTPTNEYMSTYVDMLAGSNSLKPATLAGYKTSLGHITRHIGDIPISALTPTAVQGMVNALNADGYSPSTVRKAYMLLHQAMQRAAVDGLISSNPCMRGAVKLPQKAFTKPNALDENGRARVVRLLDGMERTPATVAAYIALYTGMRQGEVAGLRWRAVDMERDTIHVCEAISKARDGGVESKDPKTHQDRYIPLAKGLKSVLQAWRDERRAACAGTATDAAFESFFVVGDLKGNPRTPHTLGKDWTAIAKIYGINGTQGKRVTFHDLRHTFATATIAAGADVRSVSDILGHENVAMTLNVYADASPLAKRRTVDILDTELETARSADNIIPIRAGVG